MEFIQHAPPLDNQYTGDRVLRGWLDANLPRAIHDAIASDLDALGAHAASAWDEARQRPAAEPVLTQWDAWGRRIDRIDCTPVWRRGAGLAARFGLVASGHEPRHGEYARCDQFARVYLHHVASEFFTCPLAMSDGAATALKASANQDLIDRAVPRLLSRDARTLWLSGQWMTETAGGSDVGHTATIARRDEAGEWRLHGRKWFTSAVIGEMALTLAKVEGGDGLDLFLVETRLADGAWNGIRIDRFKHKLGTRELPTAEIRLDGSRAHAVADGGAGNGVRLIAPMLNVTRVWNAVCALATMRRCIALAVDYARWRQAFGKPIIEHSLHAATLADMQAEFEAAFHLVFHVAHLLGRSESAVGDPRERALLRLLTPLTKLWTARVAVAIASETCEAFGGAGYIEDTGIPLLLRDAQVYPIWEGTTNVLALDALRAIASNGLEPLIESARTLLDPTADAPGDTSDDAPRAIRAALEQAAAWLRGNQNDAATLQAGARGLAITLSRTFAAALLHRHAANMRAQRETRPRLALARFIAHGLDRLERGDAASAAALFD